ncbi:MAG: acyl-CoA dehydrogenase family protein [Acidobacteriota bacterium]|nr:acyl-CoA dehydrogenase family protein [Acidobacteriota bacterium]
MANFFSDNQDLRWYLEKGIDWDPIVDACELGLKLPDGFRSVEEAREFYLDIVMMFGEFVAEEVAPHAAEIDREGVIFEDGEAKFPPHLAAIFETMRELDVHGMCLPRELGGVNAPVILYSVHNELLGRAEQAVMTHYSFHAGTALAMLLLSIDEGTTEFDREKMAITRTRFAEQIEEIARGDAWGCMDITEPDAGSDMAALRASGEQGADGSWTLTGQKIFVTSGHGKYHFVIARTEARTDADDAFAGLEGLSMFLVKAYDDTDGGRTRHAKLDRLEEKLGHHASVTASLSFDKTPALLVGERGEGFKHMLTLMNGARVSVGFESIGLCEAAFRTARAYAAERRSMGKTIDRHEMIADYLDEMRTDIQGLRALAMYCAVHQELADKERLRLLFDPPADELERKRLERRIKAHKRRLRRATPLLKYLAAERSVEMARRCIQIHGGNGYTIDYPAEKLLRDSLVLPIYEGTSQIQALMATRDTLNGILKNPQAFVRLRAQAQWRSVSGRDALERRVARVQTLSFGAQQHLMTRLAGKKFRSLQGTPLAARTKAMLKDWDPKRDFAPAQLHAERLTALMAEAAICRILLDQARKHPERQEVLERYLERAEPRCRFFADQIHTTGARLLEELAEPVEEASAL